jgi:hypothetical protein
MTTQGEKKLSTSDIAFTDRDITSNDREATIPVRRQDDPVRADRVSGIDDAPGPLFDNADADGFRTRWSAIQTGFVDEPRKAVEEADTLVAEVMKRLAEVFATERTRLESQWERSDQVSTEDLRLAMRRYRSFFERLLSL